MASLNCTSGMTKIVDRTIDYVAGTIKARLVASSATPAKVSAPHFNTVRPFTWSATMLLAPSVTSSQSAVLPVIAVSVFAGVALEATSRALIVPAT